MIGIYATHENGRIAMLNRALASVMAQTWESYEVFVVDDGSPLKAEIAEECKKWKPLFEAKGVDLFDLHLPFNTGSQSTPFNHGIQFARADYVAYLDCDDEWLPAHLAVMMEAIESDVHTDFVYAQHRFVKGEPIPDLYLQNLPRDAHGNTFRPFVEFSKERIEKGPQFNFIGTCDMLHSRNAAFARVLRPTGMLWRDGSHQFNDWDFVNRFAGMNGRFKGVNAVLSVVHFHGDNFTTKGSSRKQVGERAVQGRELWMRVRSSSTRHVCKVAL